MALGQHPQERTREELFEIFGFNHDHYFMDKLSSTIRALRDFEIEISPNLQDEAPDGIYLLKVKGQKSSGSTSSSVIERIARHESASQEFKSTYWCDLDRRKHDSNATIDQLRSEAVKQTALKTIAGFLTSGGGTLFIGVADDRSIVGLEPDLEILTRGAQNVDHLINNIKTDIDSRFRDGSTVNDYVTISVIDLEGAQLLQLDITSRQTLSFLATPNGNHELFRRQDNRTTSVKIYEVEEFQRWRNT